MKHDWERVVALRRDVASGAMGGASDRSTAQDAESGTFEVSCSCPCGELVFHPVISDFFDLLAAGVVLAARHREAFDCMCDEPDEATVKRAIATWRDEYGTDPIIPILPEGGNAP